MSHGNKLAKNKRKRNTLLLLKCFQMRCFPGTYRAEGMDFYTDVPECTSTVQVTTALTLLWCGLSRLSPVTLSHPLSPLQAQAHTLQVQRRSECWVGLLGNLHPHSPVGRDAHFLGSSLMTALQQTHFLDGLRACSPLAAFFFSSISHPFIGVL